MTFTSRARAIVLPGAAVLFVLMASASGCGSKTKRMNAETVGEPVRYEGTLGLRGSHPFPQLVLELADGRLVQIESETIQDELKSLTSMRVSVEGEVVGMTKGQKRQPSMPIVDASRYSLLRMPTGEMPLLGTVMLIDGECILTERDGGRRFWIRGDLTGVIREYQGETLWVIGSQGAAPNAPRGTTPYWVTGYGVLGQPPAGM
jgi:hypothetical protein